MGREKLIDLDAMSVSTSGTCDKLMIRAVCPRLPGLTTALSKLTPRPPPLFAADPPRKGGSKLEARRCAIETSGISCGILGTGGASSSGPPTGLWLGDGARNDRSAMEPELECRRSPGPCWLPLPADEVDPLRIIRFVTISPTRVGGAGCVRSAAAAAVEESEPLDWRSLMKAWLAAREAAALGGALGAGFDDALRRWNIVQFGNVSAPTASP
jgi:hypothetical protein